MRLLTRDKFREAVLARDNRCCNCPADSVDAHHIVERRLWSDGGYYIENGAGLCSACHILAEKTELSCSQLRYTLGVKTILPEHLYSDVVYDKWGNPILPNGKRLKGELFEDLSVQKIMKDSLHLFVDHVKYPRTYHVPWSKDGIGDDKYLKNMDHFKGKEVVVTEKMDGENTTMYGDHIHARSTTKIKGKSYGRLLSLWETIRYDIPDNYRICGENLYLRHTIEYEDLSSYFQVFSVWKGLTCLSWEDTIEFCSLFGLQVVPPLYKGEYKRIGNLGREGYVIRLASEFKLRDFRTSVAKYVSPTFVLPPEHWSRGHCEKNGLR